MATFHKTNDQILKELALIEAAQKNPERFGPLYDIYYHQIFLFIFRRVNDEETTADITSQTFVKALSNLKKYKYKGVPFSAWLYRIASNEVNLFYRQTKKVREVNIDTPGIESLFQDLGGEVEDNTEKISILLKGFENLKEKDVQLLELRFFENRSFSEIGDILGIKENNAKVKTHRVVNKLKKVVLNALKN